MGPEGGGQVLIVGGGIGGLTAALALQRSGISVRVLERAPQLGEVGAGIGLWANAMRVLDRLGVGDRIRAIGSPLRVAEICSSSGDVLIGTDVEQVMREPGAANHVVHRAELHAVLAEALPAGILTTGAECVGLEQDAEGVTVLLRDGSPVRGRLLVGADGLHSVVRRELWGEDTLRYSGQTCFRGIAHIAPPDPGTLREVQGPGKRAGICPMDGERVYWWAALNAPRGEAEDAGRRKERLLGEFAGWPFHLPRLIEATGGEILRNDLVDRRPLRRWCRGRVALLGDAAHPMLPNLGQGACTAMEDGLVLARSLAEHGLSPAALLAYQRQRIRRTTVIVRQSWNFGIPARWSGAWAVGLREALIRALPREMMARQIRMHLDFDAGSLTPGTAPMAAPH